MRTVDALGDLRAMDQPVVTTREAATRMKTSSQNAGRRLRALEKAGLTRRLKHGLWALDPAIEPFSLTPYLTAPHPSYVSLWSALSQHDMIEQIPRQISVASLDRARRVVTTLGVFAIHHLAPEVFGGYEGNGRTGYLATPEKALFDTVYVRSAAGDVPYFTELSIPGRFDRSELGRWVDRIPAQRLRTIVGNRLDDALDKST